MSSSLTWRVEPGASLRGDIRVPGDKSISHRSIMFGALARGTTEVRGFLEGEDSLNTLKAFRAMGVDVEGPRHGEVIIHGVGMRGLSAPAGPLDLGNSGTSMRLLAGLLSGQAFDVELRGDESLSRRPMRRVTEPLSRMGALVETTADGTPPLLIHGGRALHGVEHRMGVASAQVKSALLLAGLYADGETRVIEPAVTRDHTERMLQAFGYKLQRSGSAVWLQGGGSLHAASIEVPADISSAAFFLVGASIAPGSDLILRHVGMNPTRTGVIDILRLMGADIEILDERICGAEPVADLRVRHAPLHGIDVPEHLVPLAIDEFPVLFVAAACAEGVTRVTGAEELRVKESDRIQSTADGLIALGIDAEPQADGLIVQGGALQGGRVDSRGDHRIAMAFAMGALRAAGSVEITDCANVATSFPGFVELVGRCGMRLQASAA